MCSHQAETRGAINALNPMQVLLRLAFSLLCIIPVSAGSANAQAAQTITLNDAVRIAMDQNYLLKVSSNTVRQRENTLRGARYFLVPGVSFSTNAGRNFGLSFDQTTGNVVNYSSDRFGLSAGASMVVFSGMRDWAALRQAELNVTGSGLDHERQRQQVVFTVMDQYLILIQARSQVGIQEENLAAQQQLLAQIEEFVNAGSRPVSDLYQQQAATANAELGVLDAQRNVEGAENRLIQTLQLDPFGGYEFVVPDLSERDLIPEAYDVEELVRIAFDRRLDLRAREVDIGVSRQGIRIARGGWMPRLSLSAGAGTSYSSVQGFATGGRTVPFGTQLENNRSESIGISLSVPIFDNFATKTALQNAKISLNNAQLGLENLRQDIRLSVRQAHLDYLRDEKSLDVTEKQLAAAVQALEAAQERYNVGSSTLVELAQAQSAYVAAANNRVSAINSFFFRKLLIDYYTGVLDPSQPLFE